MYFASFGEEVLSAISSFASQASSALIDEIRIPLLTCLTIYFLIKGYLITYGRIDSPLSDFILTAGKILLVTYFGLNALNYVNDVIPAIRGLENMLVGILRLPGAGNVDTQGAWTAIDDMWKQLMLVTNVALSTAGKVSVVSAFGTWLSLFFLGLLMAAISVALTFAATGVLIINEISLTLALAFGPLFICCLMFPAVRSWFDGWIKAVVTYVFCSVLVAAVILLVTNIFHSFATDLLNSLRAYESGRPLISVWLPVLKFSVLGLALTSLVKLIPSIAAAIVGGVALQAAGLGQMMNDTWRGTRDITGGFVNGLGKGSAELLTKSLDESRRLWRTRDGRCSGLWRCTGRNVPIGPNASERHAKRNGRAIHGLEFSKHNDDGRSSHHRHEPTGRSSENSCGVRRRSGFGRGGCIFELVRIGLHSTGNAGRNTRAHERSRGNTTKRTGCAVRCTGRSFPR